MSLVPNYISSKLLIFKKDGRRKRMIEVLIEACDCSDPRFPNRDAENNVLEELMDRDEISGISREFEEVLEQVSAGIQPAEQVTGQPVPDESHPTAEL